ncbi:hypothetical protein HOY80DRAFT_1024120 [Tuber brumale]|nr:hypothetical protein HOY80DRAFT_1024120 [Tuber brumale]
MEGSPKIDYEKLARKMNYKSAAVANARFYQIKRAVMKASDAAPGSPPPSPAKKVEKVEKVKKKAVVEENGVVKKRGRGRPRKVIVVAPVGGEEGRGARAFGEDFGQAAEAGEGGGIDPRILDMGRGNRVEEEEDETEIEGEKGGGGRFLF